MSKFRKILLLLGFIVIPVVASLVTFLGLSAAGVIIDDTTPLVYTIESASKVYDGTPLKATSATLTEGQLKEGHQAQFSFNGEITEVGESTSDVLIKIVDGNGVDVTNEYSIKVNKGTLTVTKQAISIILDDCEMEYNGGELICDNYEIVSGYLAAGHVIVPTTDDATLVNVHDELPDASTFVPYIYDNSGHDKSYNYDITFSIGTNVKINPRALVIKPADLEFTYDGKEHVFDSYEILRGSLVDGHYIEATYEDENGIIEEPYINVLEEEMTVHFNSVRILTRENGVEVDVTENYDLTYSDTGSVMVNKALVEIELNNVKSLYTGNAFGSEEGYDGKELFSVIESADKLILNNAGANIIPNLDGLASIKEEGEHDFYLFSDSLEGDANYISLDVEDNYGEDITSNFEFVLLSGTPGTITITKLELDLYLEDFETYFTNKEYKLDSNTDFLKEEVSIPGMEIEVTFDVEKIEFEGLEKGEFPVNAGEYKYTLPYKITKIENEVEEDITSNVLVNLYEGTVTINQVEVVLDLKDFAAIEYSGLDFWQSVYPLTGTTPEQIAQQIVAQQWYENIEFADTKIGTVQEIQGQKVLLIGSEQYLIVPKDTSSINVKEVGTYEYYLDSYDKPYTISFAVINASKQDVSDNFNLVMKYGEPGKFEIKKKDVYLTLNSYAKSFDEQTFAQYLLGDEQTLDLNKLVTVDTELTAINKLLVTDASTILPLALPGTYEYYLNDKSREYYINVNFYTFDLDVDNLASLTPEQILSKGKDSTNNFNVILLNGQTSANIEIVAPEITVTFKSHEKTYDGLSYSISENDCYTYEGLPEEYGIKLNNWTLANKNIIDANDYENTAIVVIYNKKTNNPIDPNWYVLNVNPGTIKVNPVDITLTFKEDEVDFTGNKYNISEQNSYVVEGLPANHVITLTDWTLKAEVEAEGIIKPGEYTNTTSEIKVFPTALSSTPISTNNYNLTIVDGLIVINKVNFEITLNNLEDYTYDTKSLTEKYAQDSNWLSYVEPTGFTVDVDLSKLKVSDAGTYNYAVNGNGDYDISLTIKKNGIDYTDCFEFTYEDEITEKEITINPIELMVELKQLEKTYNNKSILEDETDLDKITDLLVKYDKNLIPSGLKLTVANSNEFKELIEAGKYTYYLQEDNKEYSVRLQVLDMNFEDNINNFKLVVKNEKPGTITINKMDLFVELLDLNKVYDGKEYSYTIDTLTGNKTTLPTGMKYELDDIDSIKELKDSGNYNYYLNDSNKEYYITLKIIDNNNAEKTYTENFNIIAKYDDIGLIEIEKIYIELDFESDDLFTYESPMITAINDVTEVSKYYSEVNKKLPAGATYRYVDDSFTLVGQALTNEGEYETSAQFEVFLQDATQPVDSKNVEIVINPGLITTTKPVINIEFNSFEKVFTGIAYNDVEASYVSNIDEYPGLVLTVSNGTVNNTSVYKDGEYPVDGTISVKYNSQELFGSTLVEINKTTGLLTVDKAELEVELLSGSKTYDGLANTASINTSWVSYTLNPMFAVETNNSIFATFVNSGTYSYELSDLQLKIKHGEIDYTDCFDIQVINEEAPTVVINKKEIVIKLKDKSAIYTGGIFNKNNIVDYIESCTDDLTTDKFNVIVEDMINAGEYEYYVEFADFGMYKNYELTIDGDFGLFKVNPKEISITGSITKTYDGAPIDFNVGTYTIEDNEGEITNIKVGSLLPITKEDKGIIYSEDISAFAGETVAFGISNAPIDTTLSFDDTNSELVLLDLNGNDVTSNYKLTKATKVDLVYNKCSITIIGKNISLAYIPGEDDGDGIYSRLEEEVGELGYLSDYTPVALGDYIEQASFYEPSIDEDTGVIEDFEVNIYRTKDNANMNNYYIIEEKIGYFNIIPYSLTINLNSYEYTYDGTTNWLDEVESEGEEKYISNINSVNESALDELQLSISSTLPEMINAGTYSYTLEMGDEDYVKYYDLTIVPGTIKVRKQDVNVTLKTFTETYKADGYDADDITDFVVSCTDNLFTEADFDVVSLSMENAGTYSYTVVFNSSVDDAENYNLIVSPGTFIITKKEVNVALKSFTETYKGEAYDENDITEFIISCTDGFDEADFKVIASSMENAGTYTYTVVFDLTEEETKNYILNVTAGTFTVAKKDVYVTLTEQVFSYEGYDLRDDVVLPEAPEGIEFTISAQPMIAVGSYYYSITVSDDTSVEGDGLQNYNIHVIGNGLVRII